ncbi:alanine racemase [bacterium]|nr:alanine racemase [bacterium]
MSYCWAEIDLNAILFNLKKIREIVGDNVKIMAIVKADAYGHGLEEVAKQISSKENVYFGVSSLQEGIRLREEGIDEPVVNLLPPLPQDIREMVHWGITPIITNDGIAKLIDDECKRQGKILPVHIKIDTGMGRLGIRPESAVDFVLKIREYGNLFLEGIYTHFASADTDKEFTEYQLKVFLTTLKKLEEKGIKFPLRHSANSSAILNFSSSHLDMVRPGIALYGVNPSPYNSVKLKPAMSVKAKVIQVKELPAGHSISYGRTHILSRNTRVAVIGIGYAQGLLRALSNKGSVLINGKRAPILGIICMDQCVIDVTDSGEVRVGDEAVIMGKQDAEEITAWELANLSGTIPYELLTAFGHQLPRRYKFSEQ